MTTSFTDVIDGTVTYGVIVVMVFLMIAAVFVQDTAYIVSHPLWFTIEVIAFGAGVAALFVIVLHRSRSLTFATSIKWFAIMTIKFALMHVFFQLAGIYTRII
jgi:hypothetical protein